MKYYYYLITKKKKTASRTPTNELEQASLNSTKLVVAAQRPEATRLRLSNCDSYTERHNQVTKMMYRSIYGLEVPSPDGRRHQRCLRTAGLWSCHNLSSKQLFASQLEMVVADGEEKIAEIATCVTNADSNIRKKENGKKMSVRS